MRALEVQLRLACPCCSAHHLTGLHELAAGAFLCGLCQRTSDVDRITLRRFAAQLDDLLKTLDARAKERARGSR